MTGVGITALALGHRWVGAALVFAGVGSMAAAALVLVSSARDKARAAVTQGLFPVISIVLLILASTRNLAALGVTSGRRRVPTPC